MAAFAARPLAAPQKASARFPGLDGLRGISILLVMVSHLGGTPGGIPARYQRQLSSFGALGVYIFFVISGFLITVLLLREETRLGRVNLRHFYVRRALRILPVFYLYLATVVVLRLWGVFSFSWSELLPAATFTRNLFFGRAEVVSHFWSLAVEEQYYLVWPLLLIWAGRRRALWVAATAVLAGPPVFTLCWHLNWRLGYAWLPIQFLAAGCVLGLCRDSLHRQPGYQKLLNSHWISLLPPLVLGCMALAYGTGGGDLARIAFMTMACALALGVDAAVSRSTGHRWLEWPPLAQLGILSYSVYIWQQLFLRHEGTHLMPFPLNMVAALACGAASYYSVERWALRWKRRFQPTATPAERTAVRA